MAKKKIKCECPHCHNENEFEVEYYYPLASARTKTMIDRLLRETDRTISDLELLDAIAQYLDEISKDEAEKVINYAIKYIKRYNAIPLKICEYCHLSFMPSNKMDEIYCSRPVSHSEL